MGAMQILPVHGEVARGARRRGISASATLVACPLHHACGMVPLPVPGRIFE
jgi:hypothetical protein